MKFRMIDCQCEMERCPECGNKFDVAEALKRADATAECGKRAAIACCPNGCNTSTLMIFKGDRRWDHATETLRDKADRMIWRLKHVL